ncbi:hypothetical protein CFP56_029389 [Quercus suber]|uniref:Uncharacterized protein n=1 Tax=Quercus suber TaxID=58331 RepID=A0AAW0LUU8_QUESU
MDLLNDSSDSEHQEADFEEIDDLLLAAYLGGFTVLKELEAVDTSVKTLYDMIQASSWTLLKWKHSRIPFQIWQGEQRDFHKD